MPRRSTLSLFVLLPLFAACGPGLPLVPAAAPGVVRAEVPAFAREGVASWYGPGFAGRLTANGEIFDPSELTAAHRTLPFDTRLRVTNLANGRSVVVRINDRGPFVGNRIIDLSRAAAERIGMVGSGTARVRIEPLSGTGGTLTAAADPALAQWDVVVPGRRAGELLLASGPGTEAVLVRVVGNVIPTGAGAGILVSEALLAQLGASLVIEPAQ